MTQNQWAMQNVFTHKCTRTPSSSSSVGGYFPEMGYMHLPPNFAQIFILTRKFLEYKRRELENNKAITNVYGFVWVEVTQGKQWIDRNRFEWVATQVLWRKKWFCFDGPTQEEFVMQKQRKTTIFGPISYTLRGTFCSSSPNWNSWICLG